MLPTGSECPGSIWGKTDLLRLGIEGSMPMSRRSLKDIASDDWSRGIEAGQSRVCSGRTPATVGVVKGKWSAK